MTETKLKRQRNLEGFLKEMDSLPSCYEREKLGDYLFVLHGEKKTKEVPLTFLGLTHGNEIAGYSILMKFLEFLKALKPKLPFSIGIALGNYKAYCEDKRFLEHDLNRSFSVSSKKSWEHERADEISKLLKRSQYLLDFHQTQRACSRPFFIFPYQKRSLDFAASLHSELSIVTHWGKGFSKDGQCTDEYLNGLGGTGISLETGYRGKDPLQIALGFQLILKAIFQLAYQKEEKILSPREEVSFKNISLYTWSHVYPYPKTGSVFLKNDLSNFSLIPKGFVLGSCDGVDIRAEEEGYLLFPKYVNDSDPRPQELFRLVKPISLSDLPSS